MKWTTEKPTEEGWYFIRREYFSDGFYWIDENYIYSNPKREFTIFLNDFIKDNPGVKFAGPYEEPEID